jgi:DNA polymerase-4
VRGGLGAELAGRPRERFAAASPALIPGIGPKTVERLEKQGIDRLDRLGATPDSRLAEWFGDRLGPQLARLARFEDDRPLETERARQPETREPTFDQDLEGLGALEPALERLARRLCDERAQHDRSGRTVGIKLRLDDWTTLTRARTIDEPTNDYATVHSIALDLLRALDPERPVRLLGVRIAGMEERPESHADAPPPGQLALSL